ncbi:FAD-dependent oxidoreductase [bacterium]|nr:FAD-dependent oxidoreductase [bacterium]
MVCIYSSYIILVRCITALFLLPAVVLLLILGCLATARWTELVAYIVAAVACAALWTHSVLPRAQTLVRAGAYPLFCGGGENNFPKTEEELRRRVRSVVEKTGAPPTIVGSGWSFFLNRRAAAKNRVFLQEFNSRIGETTWQSGVTAGHVCKQLKKIKKTLSSRPTLDDITLGSWIAANGHGNASTLAGGTSNTFQEVRILDMVSDSILTLSGKDTKKLFEDRGAYYKYCVLTCKLLPVYDGVVKMKGVKVKDAESAADWLTPTSQLRVLFLGAARSYGLGVLWKASSEADLQSSSHVNPHLFSRVCFYLQVDTCSAIVGWHEPMSKYNGHSRLSDANRWSYTGWPLGIGLAQLGIVFTGLHNFEIFFIHKNLDGESLWQLCEQITTLHKSFGGRCELRVATEGALNIVHVDVAFNVTKSRLVFDILYNFGVREAALHRGKRLDGVDNGRVVIVPVSELFEIV